MRNLDNFRQAVESPKSGKLMAYFLIYPTLLPTSCVKIHQMIYVIFHDTAPLYLFTSNITYFLQKQSIKVDIFRLATAFIKIHQIPHAIFGTKSQFFFKLCITLQCHETNSSVLFHLNLYMLWTKGSDQSVNFQTFDCLHGN